MSNIWVRQQQGEVYCLLIQLCLNMNIDGRRPLMEDKFYGRQPLKENDLQWKTTFEGKRPSMEDSLLWKTTLDERQPLKEDNF